MNEEEKRNEITRIHFEASKAQFECLKSIVRGNLKVSWSLYIFAVLILILGACFSESDGKGFQRSGSLLVAITLFVISFSSWASTQLIDQSDGEFKITGVGIKINPLNTGIATGLVALIGTIVWGFGDIVYKWVSSAL